MKPDQPKPASGEWTVVRQVNTWQIVCDGRPVSHQSFDEGLMQAICDAHKAALDALQQNRDYYHSETHRLSRALAAERKAHEQDREKWMRDIAKGAKLQEQLAAERKNSMSIQTASAEFAKQLAAAKEQFMQAYRDATAKALADIQPQLAAAVEARQALERLLEGVEIPFNIHSDICAALAKIGGKP